MSSNFLNPVTTQTWANGRHLVRCVKVIQETWDVRTFCFMADQPILFFFKPGQFVTLELEIDGEPVMRSYTISSSPSVPYSFSITIKRVPGGRVSNWLHDNLKEGQSYRCTVRSACSTPSTSRPTRCCSSPAGSASPR